MRKLREIALNTYNSNGYLVEPNATAQSYLGYGETGNWELTAETLGEAEAQAIPARLFDAARAAAVTAGHSIRLNNVAGSTLSHYADLYVTVPDDDGGLDSVSIELRFASHAKARRHVGINIAPGAESFCDFVDALGKIKVSLGSALITVGETPYQLA